MIMPSMIESSGTAPASSEEEGMMAEEEEGGQTITTNLILGTRVKGTTEPATTRTTDRGRAKAMDKAVG